MLVLVVLFFLTVGLWEIFTSNFGPSRKKSILNSPLSAAKRKNVIIILKQLSRR